MKFWCSLFFIVLFFGNTQNAAANPLVDRLNKFPQWDSKPLVQLAERDLIYPDWFAGNWQATSTLIEQIAPLAPQIVTPGFSDNQNYQNKPVQFQVKFVENYTPKPTKLLTSSVIVGKLPVIADRAFNGYNIARSYLGDDAVVSVKIDPDNPNKQITFLKGKNQLVSTVTGRNSETPAPDRFLSTEVTQQFFRNQSRLYLNEVETTTDYRLVDLSEIEANQITAIYLSPKDPNYFTAAGRPVALYRYHLLLEKF
ncbi:MAG: DUF6816 family protein [Xenococcaceae cyanobacterium]